MLLLSSLLQLLLLLASAVDGGLGTTTKASCSTPLAGGVSSSPGGGASADCATFSRRLLARLHCTSRAPPTCRGIGGRFGGGTGAKESGPREQLAATEAMASTN